MLSPKKNRSFDRYQTDRNNQSIWPMIATIFKIKDKNINLFELFDRNQKIDVLDHDDKDKLIFDLLIQIEQIKKNDIFIFIF